MAVYNSYWKEIKSTLFKSLIYNRLSTNQIKSNEMLVFGKRGRPEYPGENRSYSRVENQQTQPTYDAECGNRTRATLVEGKCSHHYANPATVPCHRFVGMLSKPSWNSTLICSSSLTNSQAGAIRYWDCISTWEGKRGSARKKKLNLGGDSTYFITRDIFANTSVTWR